VLVTKMVFDCSTPRERLLWVTTYNTEGRVVYSGSIDEKWTETIPGTQGESTRRFVCDPVPFSGWRDPIGALPGVQRWQYTRKGAVTTLWEDVGPYLLRKEVDCKRGRWRSTAIAVRAKDSSGGDAGFSTVDHETGEWIDAPGRYEDFCRIHGKK
jgi:hypothetical protein